LQRLFLRLFTGTIARLRCYECRQSAKEKTVNSDQIKGKWTQLKGSVKAKWGDLTDDDLAEIEGETEKLAGKLQERYGIEREEAKRRVDEWSKSL